MRKMNCVAAAAAIALTAISADAAVFQFEANLSGAQEVPPNNSPGVGFGSFTFDDTTNVLSITTATFSGLLANASNAHIHIGAAGVAGPVVFFTPFTPATSGTVTGSGVLNATQINALFAGNLYLNIHSTAFPGGEIRGQLIQIPAPGALALIGLVGLTGSRRRRA